MASFWKSEACGQTVLPDRSVFIGKKLVEIAKIDKFKCDISRNFQTMKNWIFGRNMDFRHSVIWIIFSMKIQIPIWIVISTAGKGWDIFVDFQTLWPTCAKKYLKKIRQSDPYWDSTNFGVSDFRKLLSLINYRVCQQVWSVFKNHQKKFLIEFSSKKWLFLSNSWILNT